nr:CPBP family intramembrane glutamic endopeptidase [Cohnella lubricantis]
MIFIFVKTVLTNSLGEELGWRGYLLPVMMGSMGKKPAMLLNGVIHGVWHFPLIINTDAYHAGEQLWILLPLTVASTTFLAPVIGEVRLRTGSVWTSSIFHTMHNWLWLILGTLTVNHSESAQYISGDMSIVVVLFYAAFTFYLWNRKASTDARAPMARFES